VLAGEDALDAAIAADPGLAHRVEVKVRMEPFDIEGAAAYLTHRIRQAGGAPSIIETDAVSALQRLGRALPGRINTLADNALFEAFLCGRQQVSRADVECAHRALGWEQLAEAPAARPVRTAAASPARARPAEVRPQPAPELLDPLDSELEAVFDVAASELGPPGSPPPRTHAAIDGPPKEDEPEDFLIELVED
jgi:hypothetical protein